MTKSTSPKPSYSVVPWMRARISAACASACSCVIFCLLTRLPSCAAVTSRAFFRPSSTNSGSTSFSTTGMPAEAMTWAISPPIVPAPTTAALNTNTLTVSFWLASVEVAVGLQLDREAPQRPAQCVAERATHEEQIGQHGADARVALELVGELDADLAAALVVEEAHALRPRHLRILDIHDVGHERLVLAHLL